MRGTVRHDRVCSLGESRVYRSRGRPYHLCTYVRTTEVPDSKDIGKHTYLKVLDIFASLDDYPSAFVSQPLFSSYNAVTDAAFLPEMNVTSTDACGADVDKAFIRFNVWYLWRLDLELMFRGRGDGDVVRLAG